MASTCIVVTLLFAVSMAWIALTGEPRPADEEGVRQWR
jgi:hypothetical protein